MKFVVMVLVIAVVTYMLAITLTSRNFSGTTVHLAGDSTMAAQAVTKRPLTGWGEAFASMLCEDVRVINHAQNGRSTKSFLSEGLWDDLLSQLRTGDIVNIQFGHNDQKVSVPELHTVAWRDYSDNLKRFVFDVRELGAEPVLLTSIVRRAFDSRGSLLPTLGDYPAVTRHVAGELNVELIDLNVSTKELVEALGPVTSKSVFLHLAPGAHENYPDGAQDDTHLNARGAKEVAKLLAAEWQASRPELICH